MKTYHSRFTLSALTLAMMSLPVAAAEQDTQSLEDMQQRMDAMEARFEQQLNALADELEASRSQSSGKDVHFGGYGEMHYRHLDDNGEDVRELDFHRWVLFIGYDFSERMRLKVGGSWVSLMMPTGVSMIPLRSCMLLVRSYSM